MYISILPICVGVEKHTAREVSMRIVCLEKHGLPGAELDVVQKEGAKQSDILRKLLIQPDHQVRELLSSESWPAKRLRGFFGGCNQLLGKLGNRRLGGSHERVEELPQGGFVGGNGGRIGSGFFPGDCGDERVRLVSDYGAEFRDGFKEGCNLGKRSEATETVKLGDGNRHLGLMIIICYFIRF